ncbi:MAG: cation/acetate symporter [Thermoleophilaceae bacterium]|jgi:cation/acetate symporter|nr:cation/acetate symporter [Thermoleophilaceae bacterium]
MTLLAANVNELALSIFGGVVAVTLFVTYVASKRVSSAADFWAAGRGLTGAQNGFAIAGDYMSAASFLGIAGLIFLFGFDGFLYAVGFLVAFLVVLFLLAERMRNTGKYTIADVLSYRMKQAPARTAAALGTLTVVAFYLIAQMVGAGVLIEKLVGIDFAWSVIAVGAFMLIYVVAGGMLATTWVQIIKAVLLLTTAVGLTVLVLNKVGWNPVHLFTHARAKSPEGHKYLQPGLFLKSPIDTVSLGVGLVLGTAGLPHILMRFFTVPNAKAARSSVMWAVCLIGFFYLMTTALGFGARAILGNGATDAVGKGGNLAAPLLAENLGGGAGTVGGDLLLAIVAAVAFATILAVVAGLVISASGAVAHDVWSNVIRRGRDSEREELWVAKIAAVGIGAVAIVIAIVGGPGLNVSFMVGLAFAVAASANFPALLLALVWRRFNTSGAVTGVLFGVISSVGLVIVSPTVWPGPDAQGGAFSWYDLANPAIVSVPLGFIGCWLGTVLSAEHRTADARFDELRVRSETGLGAEVATGLTLTGGGSGGSSRRAATAATAGIVTRLHP